MHRVNLKSISNLEGYPCACNQNKIMNIEIGQWYGYEGDNVKVIELLDNGVVVVECPEYGELEADASKLVNTYPAQY